MEKVNLPLIEYAEGITQLSNWQVILREHCDFAEIFLNGKAKDEKRSYKLLLTLHHEYIHFLQGLTTSLPYSYSLNLLELCSKIMDYSRDKKLTIQTVLNFKETYNQFNNFF